MLLLKEMERGYRKLNMEACERQGCRRRQLSGQREGGLRTP